MPRTNLRKPVLNEVQGQRTAYFVAARGAGTTSTPAWRRRTPDETGSTRAPRARNKKAHRFNGGDTINLNRVPRGRHRILSWHHCCAVPEALGSLNDAFPPLKRWAFLFRPAGRDSGHAPSEAEGRVEGARKRGTADKIFGGKLAA